MRSEAEEVEPSCSSALVEGSPLPPPLRLLCIKHDLRTALCYRSVVDSDTVTAILSQRVLDRFRFKWAGALKSSLAPAELSNRCSAQQR